MITRLFLDRKHPDGTWNLKRIQNEVVIVPESAVEYYDKDEFVPPAYTNKRIFKYAAILSEKPAEENLSQGNHLIQIFVKIDLNLDCE